MEFRRQCRLIESWSRSSAQHCKQQGPDGESLYCEGPAALIYRPFHTTRESRREKQPYVSRRGFVVTWDGRLDNREELNRGIRGDLDRSATDVCRRRVCFRPLGD